MKKVSTLLAAVSMSMLLMFCLGGCSSGSGQETVSTEPTVQTQTAYVMKERSTLLDNYEYSDPEFDEHGNLIKITEIQPKNKNVTNTITFEYSDDGVLQKRIDDIEYNALYDSYVITTTYDDKGEVVKVDSTRDPEKYLTVIPADFVVGLTEGDYDNTYNEQGQLIEQVKQGSSLTIKYEYNDAGELIKATTYGGASEEPSTTTYTYDDNGNLIREDVKTGDSSWSNLYTYESIVIEVEN